MLKSLESFIELLDIILSEENENDDLNQISDKSSRMDILIDLAKKDQLRYDLLISPTLTISFHVYLMQKEPINFDSFVRINMNLNPKYIDNQLHICTAGESSNIQTWVAYNTTSKLTETIRDIIVRLDQTKRLFD